MNHVAAINVRPITIVNYQYLNRNYIQPRLGHYAVQDLTPGILDQWMRELTIAGYAHSTLESAKNLLHNMLKYAVFPAQLIQSNPASYIKVPQTAPENVVTRKVIRPDEFKEILVKAEKLSDSDLKIPLSIMYHTGMRISEVAGLCWQDIDLKEGSIIVNRTLNQVPRVKGWHIGKLKSKSSHRKIFIDSELIATLTAWKKHQKENELWLGSAYVKAYVDADKKVHCMSKRFPPPADMTPVALVCTDDHGKHNIVRVKYVLSKLGYNSHSFRHSHATMLIENGATLKGVAGRLGHKDAKLTVDLYTHFTDKMARDTGDVFEKIMQTRPSRRHVADMHK